jgi:hypothetical protein
MGEKSIKGGKRLGAGRKPVSNPKKQVSLYIEPNKFYKFGGEEKMKVRLYEFIESYSNEIVETVEQPKIFDAPRLPKNYFEDEPKQFGEAKPLSEFEGFKERIYGCKTVDEVEKVMRQVKSALMLPREKLMIESIAKDFSKEFYND